MSSSPFNIKSVTLDFLKSRKSYFIAYLLLNLSYPLNYIVVPHYYGKLIELLSKTENKELIKTFAKTIAIWVTSIAGMSTLSKIDGKIIPEYRSYLYTKIAEFIFSIHKEDYTSFKLGELVSKLSKLPYLIMEIFYQIRTSYIPLTYVVIFCLIYFFSVNAQLAGLIIAVLIFFAGIAWDSARTCMPVCVNAESSGDLANENLQDILENILNVYTSNNLEEELKNFGEKDEKLQGEMRSCMRCASKYKFAFGSLYLLSFIVISVFSYTLYKNGKISLSQISSVLIVVIYLLGLIDTTVQYSQDTISYIGSIIDIQNYIDNLNIKYEKTSSHIDKLNKGEPLYQKDIENVEGRINFKNIDICFNGGCILKNFSYEIKPGSKVAIIGKVGCGKSSLLKMILKLSYPTSGNILIDGKNMPYDMVREHVSYINQNPMLFNRSLYENIIYGTNKTRKDVENLLQKYKLEEIFGKRDLDSPVGKSGSNLSGGQKQIVLLLRAVLRNTSILLLDEPTTALDRDVRDTVMNLVFDMFRNKTIVMVTHDMELLDSFEIVLNMDKYKLN